MNLQQIMDSMDQVLLNSKPLKFGVPYLPAKDVGIVFAEEENPPLWIGVDFDGTLVVQKPFPRIGPPVPKMVKRVKKWIRDGCKVKGSGLVKTVKIFTARASSPEQKKIVADWTEKHLGKRLEVTNKKTPQCVRIVDNISVRVKQDTGEIMPVNKVEAKKFDPILPDEEQQTRVAKETSSEDPEDHFNHDSMLGGGPGSGRHPLFGTKKITPQVMKDAIRHHEQMSNYHRKALNDGEYEQHGVAAQKHLDAANHIRDAYKARQSGDKVGMNKAIARAIPAARAAEQESSMLDLREAVDTAKEKMAAGGSVSGRHKDIKAGGPGSGRHPYATATMLDVLSHHGFEKAGNLKSGSSLYKNDSGDIVIHNPRTGIWLHKEKTATKPVSGTKMQNLDHHLSRIYGNDSYKDYVNNTLSTLRPRRAFASVEAGAPLGNKNAYKGGSGRRRQGFHGTTEALGKIIAVKGLKPSIPKGGVHLGGRAGVFFVKDRDMAIGYALEKTKEYYKSLGSAVPAGTKIALVLVKSDKLTQHPGVSDYLYSTKTIAPSKIEYLDYHSENKRSVEAGAPLGNKNAYKGGPKYTVSQKGRVVNKQLSDIAKAHAVRIAMKEQNYAENKIQGLVAKAVGGDIYGHDSEPVDVVTHDSKGGLHGIEVKGIINQQSPARKAAGQLPQVSMKREAVARKQAWAQKNKAALHTVIVDVRASKTNPTVYHSNRVGNLTFGNVSRAGAKLVNGGLSGLKKVIERG